MYIYIYICISIYIYIYIVDSLPLCCHAARRRAGPGPLRERAATSRAEHIKISKKTMLRISVKITKENDERDSVWWDDYMKYKKSRYTCISIIRRRVEPSRWAVECLCAKTCIVIVLTNMEFGRST